MQNLIEQYRLQPTAENAQLLREYFERNPGHVFVLQGEARSLLVAAGVPGVTG